MTMAETLLAEFEQEAKTTRKFLERLPPDKLAWKPHEKSMSAGQLALHIADSVGRVIEMASADSWTARGFGENPSPASVDEVLKTHDASVENVRKLLPKISDAAMQGKWQLLDKEGKQLMAMPRANVLRTILLNHWYHHRGQFGVYLRLLGAKVPSSYGPSGDEMPDFANNS